MLSSELLVIFTRSKLDIFVFGLGLSSGDRLISLSWSFRKSRSGVRCFVVLIVQYVMTVILWYDSRFFHLLR